MHGWKASKKARILYSIGYEAGVWTGRRETERR